jgi:hypothetical protein
VKSAGRGDYNGKEIFEWDIVVSYKSSEGDYISKKYPQKKCRLFDWWLNGVEYSMFSMLEISINTKMSQKIFIGDWHTIFNIYYIYTKLIQKTKIP